jgi:isocitrate/isopropylmalate dehydrogenase
MSAAQTVETGVSEALLKGLTVPDLGGKLRTVEMGEAIADEVMRSRIPRQR